MASPRDRGGPDADVEPGDGGVVRGAAGNRLCHLASGGQDLRQLDTRPGHGVILYVILASRRALMAWTILSGSVAISP